MLCPQCGASLDKSYKYCPSCGAQLPSTEKNSQSPTPSNYGTGGSIGKRRMPLWFKILASLAVIALIGVTAGILFTESLVDVIDHQLEALRHSDIDKAYSKYTSQEFQKETSPEEFKHFIQSYPIFSTNEFAHFTQRSIKGNIGTIRGNLTSPDHVKVPIEYKLIKEDGRWKILSLRLLNPEAVRASHETINAEELNEVVKNQLHEIKQDNILEAYNHYSSNEFKEATTSQAFQNFIKKYPILTHYESISFSQNTIRNNVGTVSAVLHMKDNIAYLKYYLIHEDNQWKIWSMRILSPNEEEKGESHSELTDQKSASSQTVNHIESIQMGSEVDDQGIIQNPTFSFPANTKTIYVNVEIANGLAGEVIHLDFQHLDSHSSILAKTKIEESGDSRLVSLFSPPAGGWPKGNYQLIISTSNKVQKTVHFTIE